jgi:hypothetical protein
MITGIFIPVGIAAALVALRLRVSKLVQSPADFLVIPLTLDLGIIFYPESFNKLVDHISRTSNGTFALINLMFLTISIIGFVVWETEMVLNRANPNNIQSDVVLALILAWGLAATIFFFHFIFLVGY